VAGFEVPAEGKEFRFLADVRGECGSAITLAELEHSRGNTKRAIILAFETVAALRTDSGLRPLNLQPFNF